MPVERGLPVSVRAESACWRIIDESWQPSVIHATRRITGRAEVSAADLLKRGPRRLVFRQETTVPEHPRVVVKAFPLDTLRHRWRHGKYGRAEAANLLIARKRGLPVPRVLAFGWQRQWGLVMWNALLMECMNGRPMKEHLSTADASAKRALLWRVLPLFRRIYETGCNHIDLGPHAILLGATAAEDCLIDFQYCRFLERPSPQTFAAQAGYFAWCLTTHWNLVPRDMVTEWFDALLADLSLSNIPELQQRFRHHLEHKASIQERLAH